MSTREPRRVNWTAVYVAAILAAAVVLTAIAVTVYLANRDSIKRDRDIKVACVTEGRTCIDVG